MEVGHGRSAAAATQALPEFNGRKILSELGNEIGGVEEAPVLAAPAHRNKGHLRAHQLAERSAGAGLPRVSIAGAHLVWGFHRHDRLIGTGGAARNLHAARGKRGSGRRGLRAALIKCINERTKREHTSRAAVERRREMPDTLEELLALEREIEREWWRLNGALHAVAELQAEGAQLNPKRFREMQAQAREVDRRRTQIAVRIAAEASRTG